MDAALVEAPPTAERSKFCRRPASGGDGRLCARDSHSGGYFQILGLVSCRAVTHRSFRAESRSISAIFQKGRALVRYQRILTTAALLLVFSVQRRRGRRDFLCTVVHPTRRSCGKADSDMTRRAGATRTTVATKNYHLNRNLS